MKRKTVFLDRDGTIIVERHYLSDPNCVELELGVDQALFRLVIAGFRLIVVSNQSGIGRGYFDVAALKAVTSRIQYLLRLEGVEIAGWYHCIHAPWEICDCRKPAIGLLRNADAEFPVDWANSYLLGDSQTDVEAALASGVTPILLGTAYGSGLAEWALQNSIKWRTNITTAVDTIISDDLVSQITKLGRKN